jgi:acetyltransferase
MDKIIRYVKSRGTKYLLGEAMLENAAMAGLAEAVGLQGQAQHRRRHLRIQMLLNPE